MTGQSGIDVSHVPPEMSKGYWKVRFDGQLIGIVRDPKAASMIASAQELYWELKECVSLLEDAYDGPDGPTSAWANRIHDARAALSRAEGRAS